MKRLILIASLVFVPVSFMFALWQAYSYQVLEAQVREQEQEQQRLFEETKRLMAQYSADSSPATIEERAARELGMAWPRQDQIIRLKAAPQGGK